VTPVKTLRNFGKLVAAVALIAGVAGCVYEPAPGPYYAAPAPAYYAPGYYGPSVAVGVGYGGYHHHYWRGGRD
jgi:hypothetical protein